MGRITSNVGLVTGIPIQDTVDQLVKVKAAPRDLLISKTNQIQQEKLAITQIQASLLSVQFTAKNLGKSALYQQSTATSSNDAALSATVTGTPKIAVRQFTPIQAAQNNQLLSSGIATNDKPLGEGDLTFRFGGFVDKPLALDTLNGGQGFNAGKIRITDRSGASAEVDLRFARTVDDVLEAINQQSGINVTASASGDHFLLTDGTGQTASNLRVQDVGGGETAESLGLSGVDVAADQAQGADVLRLFDRLSLDQLNDGLGVGVSEALPDLNVTFRDGTNAVIDLRPIDNTSLRASAVTEAANGPNAQVRFTAAQVGKNPAGANIVFEDDPNVTQGNETVVYDTNAKTLTFKINSGATTSQDIVNALNGDPAASAYFTASLPEGSDGQGVIDPADTATTALPTDPPHELTLGDVLDRLNAAAPSKLKAEIGPDGDRIVLTDLSADNGETFQVTSQFDSKVAEDLGLTGTAAGGVITGQRLLGGLKSTLLNTLDGGAGLGSLGQIQIDRPQRRRRDRRFGQRRVAR